jgi:hypothetical protein
MNHRKIVIAIGLLILGALLWSLLKPMQLKVRSVTTEPRQASSHSGVTNPTTTPNVSPALQNAQDQVARRREVVDKIQRSLATPITFYGKVVDQNGDPVPDATVNYNALDKFDAPGSQYHGQSDANGHFSISGIGGAVLSLGVRKEGYYMIDGKSANSFAYGVGPDSARRQPPTKDNPAIFVLHKRGMAEPLIHISSRTYRIPRDGTPVEVDLTTGRVSPQGHLRVEAWTEDQVKDARQHYNWRCRISVPNGGLVERKGQFDFEAPADGYNPSDEIVMPRTAEKWQPQAKRSYFIRLAGNKYARLTFYMIAQGNHFFEIESYVNPTPDSRNLEFDPNKTVKSQ